MHTKTSPEKIQALNVELLGKPIHTIRNKLEEIITPACNSLCLELQSWLKTELITVEVAEVALTDLPHPQMSAESTAVLKHHSSGLLYVNIPAPELMQLADQFYNTDIERSNPTLTNSDLRLLDRIARSSALWVSPKETWDRWDFEVISGIGICARLTIKVRDKSMQLAITLDTALIQTLIDQLELTTNPHMASDFHHTLHRTPVKLNVQLSKTILPLSQVLELKPDDILPIDLLNHAPVHIGKEKLFTGRVAEREGQLVVILNDDKELNR